MEAQQEPITCPLCSQTLEGLFSFCETCKLRFTVLDNHAGTFTTAEANFGEEDKTWRITLHESMTPFGWLFTLFFPLAGWAGLLGGGLILYTETMGAIVILRGLAGIVVGGFTAFHTTPWLIQALCHALVPSCIVSEVEGLRLELWDTWDNGTSNGFSRSYALLPARDIKGVSLLKLQSEDLQLYLQHSSGVHIDTALSAPPQIALRRAIELVRWVAAHQ